MCGAFRRDVECGRCARAHGEPVLSSRGRRKRAKVHYSGYRKPIIQQSEMCSRVRAPCATPGSANRHRAGPIASRARASESGAARRMPTARDASPIESSPLIASTRASTGRTLSRASALVLASVLASVLVLASVSTSSTGESALGRALGSRTHRSRLSDDDVYAVNRESAALGCENATRRAALGGAKRFAWLVQSAHGVDPNALASASRDFFSLSYDSDPGSGDPFKFYAPGTTWTTGRNALLERALERNPLYEYFVFLDHDMIKLMGRNPQAYMDKFEAWLDRAKPALAWTPCTKEWTCRMYRSVRQRVIHGPARLDDNFVAFHTSTLGLVLPYDSHFDSTCIFASAELAHLHAAAFYAHGFLGVKDPALHVHGREEHRHHDAQYNSEGCDSIFATGNTEAKEYFINLFRSPLARRFANDGAYSEASASPHEKPRESLHRFRKGTTAFKERCSETIPRFRITRKWLEENTTPDTPWLQQRFDFMSKFPHLFSEEGFVADPPQCPP